MMEFEDGSNALVNTDFSVTYTDEEGSKTIISGFPSLKEAENFCQFADFDEQENDYVLITKPKFKLIWNYQ